MVRVISTSSYSVERKARDRYKGRDKYLDAKVECPGAKRLCQVIEAGLAGRAKPRSEDPAQVWDGFPWLTLVLGSGCLDLPDDPGFTATKLALGVGEALSQLEWPQDMDSPATIGQDFTETLVRDRTNLKGTRVAPDEVVSPTVVEPIAARLTLIAALLTRFFHLAQSATPSAMSRWDDDVAQLDPTTAHVFEATRFLDESVVKPVIREILDVQQLLKGAKPSDDPRLAAVSALLKDILDGLRPDDDRLPRTLQVEQLRLATEVAWHLLIQGSAVYPGWTDLLLDLMLNSGAQGMKGSRRARPRYANLQALPGIVRGLLEPATTTSWSLADPALNQPTPRDQLYASAADVLWAQSDALVAQGLTTTLPPASAFVTSFDLELEMALWALSDGRPFSVAIPVHVVQSSQPEEAELCWLLGDVASVTTGSWIGQLDRIRSPSNWRLLTPELDERELRSKPTVIHLGGCPLFELPKLETLDESRPDPLVAELERVGITVETGRTTIAHAVTVDEYLALRQSEAELFWMSSHQSDRAARRSRALPPCLTEDRDTNPRFWMAIGLPIADPAIRHRVVSQITVRRLREGSEASDEPSSRRSSSDLPPRPVKVGTTGEETAGSDAMSRRSDVDGVAINLRIDDEEASLLYWLGLDVVEADCRDFIDDLFHYAAHVRDDSPMKRPSTTLQCTLTPKGKNA